MGWIKKGTPVGSEFVGRPKKNLHTDTAFAKNLGLRTVGVSATQYLGHLSELMLDLFGESWLRHGKLWDVRFVKLVADGDILTSKSKVVSKEKEGSKTRFLLNVSVENQKGEEVLVGSASGFLTVKSSKSGESR